MLRMMLIVNPINDIYDGGTYSLYITSGAKVAGVSPLTLDEANSKNLIIEPFCTECKGVAKIASDLTKKSLTATDTITITITIEGRLSLSGEFGGLKLHSSSGEDISLTCDELPSTSPGNSNTVTCSPQSDLTTAETFTLKDDYAYIEDYELTVDENSKTLTINPDCENCTGDDSTLKPGGGDDSIDTSGSFNNKFSSLLFICAGLLL